MYVLLKLRFLIYNNGRFWPSCFWLRDPKKHLHYLALQSSDLEYTWWRLFHKSVMTYFYTLKIYYVKGLTFLISIFYVSVRIRGLVKVYCNKKLLDFWKTTKTHPTKIKHHPIFLSIYFFYINTVKTIK
jgi:hypothetical protein